MRQLVKLQKQYASFKKLDAELICVLREERDGAEGLKKAQKSTKAAFPIVSDRGAKATKSYSQGGFHTYVIDKEGKIQAVLKGTKTKRPADQPILKELKALSK